MPENISNALINLGDLTKPANTLIEKISDAGVGISAPWQIKRVAKAAVVEAQSQIEITDLQRRSVRRFICEESLSYETAPFIRQNRSVTKLRRISGKGLFF